MFTLRSCTVPNESRNKMKNENNTIMLVRCKCSWDKLCTWNPKSNEAKRYENENQNKSLLNINFISTNMKSILAMKMQNSENGLFWFLLPSSQIEFPIESFERIIEMDKCIEAFCFRFYTVAYIYRYHRTTFSWCVEKQVVLHALNWLFRI